ncbi:YeiH family protein [Flavobacterium antarcticum]|uniref:YeiH family protein n=1 Tax=Flavobacterium antarcticum TaxID=271155 RepID=UPI0003B451BB|nr:putative sulfate exporter family transporter [Flavobacterium antarcticum]
MKFFNKDIINDHNTFWEQNKVKVVVYWIIVVLCLVGILSPPLALFIGIVMAQIGHPYAKLNSKLTSKLLQISVVGLGFGMNLTSAIIAGKEGIIFTVISIFGTLLLGYGLGVIMKIEKKTSFLVSAGTAICGGSAIAAVSPVIKANEEQISASLGTIFILNAIALFIFPMIGHYFELSQHQFGLWSAIAIHDTSSVVGAASSYGAEALQTATTVKLARALWIIPVAYLAMQLFKNKDSKAKIPYFIGYFILALIANTYLPFVQQISPYIVDIAKIGLTLTLFLIGTSLSAKVIKAVGVKPLIQGVILWVTISVAALYVVIHLSA